MPAHDGPDRSEDRTVTDGPGVWLGVDVGTVRVGVARSDPHRILATPVITLVRRKGSDADLDELAALVSEHEAVGVVLGLPQNLRGQEGKSAAMARDYGDRLSALIAPVPIRYVDERLTTVTATQKLNQSGVRGSRTRRALIDQAAAVELLQHWLDASRVAPRDPDRR